jgi:telomerase reverse transcriptase
MMYMFPRQFGLHNVFTSTVDYTKTAQKLQDYTLREDEIKAFVQQHGGTEGLKAIKTPKRLRGDPTGLTKRLQVLHGRCAYKELLRHYCPTALDAVPRRPPRRKLIISSTAPDRVMASSSIPATGRSTTTKALEAKRRPSGKDRRRSKALAATHPTVQFDSLTDLATPVHAVSAFCQAILTRIIPHEFWGDKERESHNLELVMKKVDHFVRLLRFESMSLLEVREGLKMADMTWLVPPQLRGRKSSASDTSKRLEILDEFLYYVFDSILIPLIRSNFYVTESNTHRNKLFFFRHDIWRHVAEPAMAALRVNMFEEVKLDEAMRILTSRKLGFSQIRLLPKGAAVRPITNLRRRTVTIGNKKILEPSINSILGSLYAVLSYEKVRTETPPHHLSV